MRSCDRGLDMAFVVAFGRKVASVGTAPEQIAPISATAQMEEIGWIVGG
jgi:hypothetical protein